MSYRNPLRRLTYYGLGQLGATAEETARAHRLNQEQGVVGTSVGPGFWDDYIDAALIVRGIPSSAADRVPVAVREVLEGAGSTVDRALWGGGSGLEDARGKVYVRWKPNAPYNAVTYADIARRMFMRAADQFPSGSRIIMQRYRLPGGWFSSDRFVYPEGGPIPASAPEAARSTNAADSLVLDDLSPWESSMAGSSRGVAIGVGVGAGALLLAGGGFLLYRHLKRRK
jgi:hypothetical protein